MKFAPFVFDYIATDDWGSYGDGAKEVFPHTETVTITKYY